MSGLIQDHVFHNFLAIKSSLKAKGNLSFAREWNKLNTGRVSIESLIRTFINPKGIPKGQLCLHIILEMEGPLGSIKSNCLASDKRRGYLTSLGSLPGSKKISCDFRRVFSEALNDYLPLGHTFFP